MLGKLGKEKCRRTSGRCATDINTGSDWHLESHLCNWHACLLQRSLMHVRRHTLTHTRARTHAQGYMPTQISGASSQQKKKQSRGGLEEDKDVERRIINSGGYR